ncbi:integral membrane protein [Aspergillus ellipticus CBS 707.79]|uniref:Integral membrane protein n=1 Tax=Aspergillus ellipticus CBS 707.79 TaxID=1448320 RepID=A0A319DQL7_9EURO|nr:integral membrane protein [Aspergillus ellipticus CBS 707.79]
MALYHYNRKQRLLLASFALLFLVLLGLCHFWSARDPGSYFFQPNEGYRPEYSVQRIHESLEWLSAYNHSDAMGPSLPDISPPHAKSACVGIVTVKRPLQQDLDTTVGSILDTLTPEQRAALTVQVLFALSDPSDHPDYNQTWLTNVVDRVLTYDDLADAPGWIILNLEKKKNIKKKSLIDYRLGLQACYDMTDAPWIIMLEDDVVAQRNWYEHTMRSVQRIEDWHRADAIKDWLYVRLFYTEKFLGWNSEHWPIYLAWSVLVVSVCASAAIYIRRTVRPAQGILTNSFLLVLCGFYVPLLIGLFFLTGRITWFPLQDGVHLMNTHGCCSQALLFNRENIPALLGYLEHMEDVVPTKAVDSVIEMLATRADLDRLAISPSQMQHVGAASYKEKKKTWKWEGPYRVKGAHGVWSMGFEKAYGVHSTGHGWFDLDGAV